MGIVGTQAINRLVHTIIRYCSGTISKTCGVELFSAQIANIRVSFAVVSATVKVIPHWKRAAAAGMEVGVHDREVMTTIVDGSHIVCSCVDLNCSVAATATNQLVFSDTTLNRIALPTERI